MATPRNPFHLARIRRFSSRHISIVAVTLLFATIGIIALLAARADTPSIAIEAEDGVIAGNAEKKDAQTGASGGTVLFGKPTDPNAPLPFLSTTTPFPNPMSGKCLDVENGTASPSTPIRIWPCNSAPAQQWTVQFTKYGASEIRALGQCLTGTVPTTVTFTNVFLSPCNGSPEQLWLPYVDNTAIRNYKSTTVGNDDLCLDVAGSNTADGTRVGLWRCLKNPAQRWELPNDAPYAGVGVNRYTTNLTKCMSLPSGNTQLQIADCIEEVNQDFFRQYIAHGYENGPTKRMKILAMGQCAETKDGGTADDTPVHVGTCSDSPAQDWQSLPVINGHTWTLKHRISGKCMDTANGQVATGIKLVIRTCDTNDTGQVFGRPPASSDVLIESEQSKRHNDQQPGQR